MTDFPLNPTSKAIAKLLFALKNDPELTAKHFVRASVKGGGCSGFQNLLDFDDAFDPDEDLEVEIGDGRKLVVDTFSALYLKDVELDYVEEGMTEGFKFNGNFKKTCGCGSSVAY